jgi:uncharacterized membrane protein
MSEFNQTPETYNPPPPPPAAVSGLTDNVAGMIAYITIIPAILFLVLEPYNRSGFIRFHAFQCLGIAAVVFASSVVAVIPILGWIIAVITFPVMFVCWILCMFNAYQGKMFKLPIIGNFAASMAKVG